MNQVVVPKGGERWRESQWAGTVFVRCGISYGVSRTFLSFLFSFYLSKGPCRNIAIYCSVVYYR